MASVVRGYEPHDCENCHMRPGSTTARREGCLCPVLDNGRGHTIPEREIIRFDCPVHGLTPDEVGDRG